VMVDAPAELVVALMENGGCRKCICSTVGQREERQNVLRDGIDARQLVIGNRATRESVEQLKVRSRRMARLRVRIEAHPIVIELISLRCAELGEVSLALG